MTAETAAATYRSARPSLVIGAPSRKYQRKTAVTTYMSGCTSRALPCISLIAV